MSSQIRRIRIFYPQNLNANKKTAYKNSINIALNLLKGNAFFVIEFAYYNIEHSKIRRSRFSHNKVSRVFCRYTSILVSPTVCTMVPERFVPHTVSELPEHICAIGLLPESPRRKHCKLHIVVRNLFVEISFSFSLFLKIYVRVHSAHSLLFAIFLLGSLNICVIIVASAYIRLFISDMSISSSKSSSITPFISS